MGPTVWELEGPIPILNNSKTLTAMSCFSGNLCHDSNLINMYARVIAMSQLVLYYQPDCHLCDEAEELLHVAGLGESYLKVDIETDLELLKQYGIYVPVLKRKDNGLELFWPFDQAEIAAFLEPNK